MKLLTAHQSINFIFINIIFTNVSLNQFDVEKHTEKMVKRFGVADSHLQKIFSQLDMLKVHILSTIGSTFHN